jgi:hypothetical protein
VQSLLTEALNDGGGGWQGKTTSRECSTALPSGANVRSPSALPWLALPEQLRQPGDGSDPPRLLRQCLRLQSTPPTGWLSQKKNKPGECKAAAEQDGPIPHIKAIHCLHSAALARRFSTDGIKRQGEMRAADFAVESRLIRRCPFMSIC